MKYRNIYRIFISLLATVVVGAVVVSAPGKISADSRLPDDSGTSSGPDITSQPPVSCSESPFSGTAGYTVPEDRYTVYVRLGGSSQPETTSLYVTSSRGDCQMVGKASATSDKWTKVGTFDASKGGIEGVFELSSMNAGVIQSYSQPSILLVSATSPACQPTTECYVHIDGEKGVVRPTSVDSTDNTLFVVRAVLPTKDVLTKVNYYVDDQYAYSTKQAEPFSMHYMGAGNHKLTTIRYYESGQEIIVSADEYRSWLDYGAKDLFVSLFYTQKGLLQYLFGISLVALVVVMIVRLARFLHRRSRWKRNHDARLSSLTPLEQVSVYINTRLHPSMAWTTKKVLAVVSFIVKEIPIVFGVLLLLVCINRYVVTFKQVSGPSMNNTFSDGEFVLVNRLGKTKLDLFHQSYVPRRGDVVILKRSLRLDKMSASTGDSEFLIKRVIGLPGDTLVIKSGVITIRNKENKKGFNPDQDAPWQATMNKEGSAFDIARDIRVTLEANEVFVCGDNRSDSIDSRAFGPIKIQDIVGKVQ